MKELSNSEFKKRTLDIAKCFDGVSIGQAMAILREVADVICHCHDVSAVAISETIKSDENSSLSAL